MKAKTLSRRIWLGLSFFICFGLLSMPAPSQAQILGVNLPPVNIIVRVNSPTDITSLSQAYNAPIYDQVPGMQIYGLSLPNTLNIAQVLLQLIADPRVVYLELDQNLTECNGNPFTFAFDSGSQPGAYGTQQAYQQVDIGTAQQWSTGAGVIIAILDTGGDLDHPALLGHWTTGYNAIQPGQLPSDVPDGVYNHGVGHGTFIAGIIAKVAPGAAIMPVRVLNGDGTGTLMNVLKGLVYAGTHGARVINMSMGALGGLPALTEVLHVVRGLGVVLVAAAGNDNTVEAQFPAISPDVLAVASVESTNTKSSYSNYGYHISLVAPGTSVRSTYWNGGYVSWSGTSFAAPFIAAEAVLMLGLPSHPSTLTVANTLLTTAHSVDSVNPSYTGELGAGLIDIQAGVSKLR